MAIEGYDLEPFTDALYRVVHPSEPIHSIEHLFGRAQELDTIQRALNAPGRHIFIYGDRGVGKSSLAATAANQYQSSERIDRRLDSLRQWSSESCRTMVVGKS